MAALSKNVILKIPPRYKKTTLGFMVDISGEGICPHALAIWQAPKVILVTGWPRNKSVLVQDAFKLNEMTNRDCAQDTA